MNRRCLAAFLAAVLIVAFASDVRAQTASPEDKLKQYVADLQRNPNDYALREKIIKHAQTMSPAPAIPEDARRSYIMGKTLFREAKNTQEYNDALSKFKSALLIAPWWADAYLDAGLAYEAAQQYDNAVSALKFYIIAASDGDKARKAQDEIYIIEARKEKTAKESTPAAVAVKKQNAYEVWLNELDGARFISAPMNDGRIGHERDLRFLVYSINGNAVWVGWIEGVRGVENFKAIPVRQGPFGDGTQSRTIQNKQFTIPQPSFLSDQRPCTATISDDGQFITVRCPSSGIPQTYTRVK